MLPMIAPSVHFSVPLFAQTSTDQGCLGAAAGCERSDHAIQLLDVPRSDVRDHENQVVEERYARGLEPNAAGDQTEAEKEFKDLLAEKLGPMITSKRWLTSILRRNITNWRSGLFAAIQTCVGKHP